MEAVATSSKREARDKDEEILVLIHERRTTKKDEKERFREVSKKIKKCIREKKEDDKTRTIQKILEELEGTKNISNVKSAKKRILIPKVKNRRNHHHKKRHRKRVCRIPRKIVR